MSHYDAPGLCQRIVDQLPAGDLTDRDLAPLDQFHVGGLKATFDLAELAGVHSGLRVLDIGSGIGGPSRWLAGQRGCRVTGVDLSPDYVELAQALAARAGLADQVDYLCANALDLPFDGASFDLAWTQHAAMNIADRARLYGEMARVVKPGGLLALHDVCQGEGGELLFPVPWASDPADSHLLSPDQQRQLLEQAGFELLVWQDGTGVALEFFRNAKPRGASSLGLHLLLGENFPHMAKTYRRNLEEGRAVVVEAVLRRR